MNKQEQPNQKVRLVVEVEFEHNMARTLTGEDLKGAAEQAYAAYIAGDLLIGAVPFQEDGDYSDVPVDGVLFAYDDSAFVDNTLIFLPYKDNSLEESFVGELKVTFKTTEVVVMNESITNPTK
jgi:hypothetical protein